MKKPAPRPTLQQLQERPQDAHVAGDFGGETVADRKLGESDGNNDLDESVKECS